MKKVLILGAGGMVGHVISTYLIENDYYVSTVTAHHKLNSATTIIDVTEFNELKKYLDKAGFDVVVNCIGMLVKSSEEHKDQAVYLNAYIPHLLEKYYERTHTKIIHLSTDCVFSGKTPPYTEDSWPDGELFYDRTKALGEIINNKDLTFRMSIVGPDSQENGIGLFNWFFLQTGEIKGYTGAIWTGVTTIELAKAVKRAIEQDITGLYHLVPSDNISKYELLKLFKEAFMRSDISITPVDGITQDKTLLNTRTDFNYKVPGYLEMVEEMKVWIDKHNYLYPHYARS